MYLGNRCSILLSYRTLQRLATWVGLSRIKIHILKTILSEGKSLKSAYFKNSFGVFREIQADKDAGQSF